MKQIIRKRRERFAVWTAMLCMVLQMTGCSQVIDLSQDASEKTKVDYTVVKPREIPPDLIEQIEEQKEEEFRITYNDTEYLYIAAGYGEQKTGGYSVAVSELYAIDQRIYLQTKLIGPRKGEQVNHAKSYPYLVIKLEQRAGEVYFE